NPDASVPKETPAQAKSAGAPDEPPPDWVAGILEPGSGTKPQAAPEQAYEPEELDHIMPWLGSPPQPGSETEQGTGKPGLPPWLSGMTVQETLQTSGAGATSAEESVPTIDDAGIEELQPFVPPDA